MAGLIALRPGVDWTASGGLFDWTLEFLIARLRDEEAVDWLRQVVENNLGSVWIGEFDLATQDEIVTHLRSELLAAAERELPEGSHKPEALRSLQSLVDLTYQSAGE
jgi:hypothetical protein